MKVILISGKSGSGKDTIASFLKKIYQQENKKVITIHFADMVKEYAKLYYGWNGEKDVAGRQLLQQLGTNTVRAAYPNYWANLVAQFLDAAARKNDFDIALIPDLRFLNEYKIVKRYNKDCYAIRINRLNSDGTYILNESFTPEQNSHSSECDLDDYGFDIMVNNSGTLEDLEKDSAEIIVNYLNEGE